MLGGPLTSSSWLTTRGDLGRIGRSRTMGLTNLADSFSGLGTAPAGRTTRAPASSTWRLALLAVGLGWHRVRMGRAVGGSAHSIPRAMARCTEVAGHSSIVRLCRDWTRLGVIVTAFALTLLLGTPAWATTVDDLGLHDGRLQEVAVDPVNPNTIYALDNEGAYTGLESDGGLFKSTDSGGTWTRVDSGITHWYRRTMQLDPSNPNTVYLAGGERLYKSTDGGNTWSLRYQFPNMNYDISCVAVAPSNPQIIYLGLYMDSATSGVWKSTNGGATFSKVVSGMGDVSVTALAVDPTDSDRVFAGTYGGGLFRTANGGTSWSAMFAPAGSYQAVDTIKIDPTDPQEVLAERTPVASDPVPSLVRTIDGGANWEAITIDPSASWREDPVSIAYTASGNDVYVACATGTVFYVSHDSGLTWSRLRFYFNAGGWPTSVCVDTTNNILYATTNGAGSGGGVLRTADVPYDVTPPTTTASTIPATPNGQSGWFISNPIIILEVDEPGITQYSLYGPSGPWTLSGDAYIYIPVYLSETVYFQSTDTDGNVEDITSFSVNVDRWVTPPTIAEPLNGAVIEGWTHEISGSAVDGVSGVSLVEVSTDDGATWSNATGTDTWSYEWAPSIEGEYSLRCRLTDNAGNVSAASAPVAVSVIPPTPPVTSLNVSPPTPDGDAGWWLSSPTVAMVRDEPGVTYYKWDGEPSVGDQVTYGTPLIVPEGEHVIYWYSVDSANNTETVKSQTFKVDTQNPAPPASPTATAASTDNIDLAWEASTDAVPGSGIAYYAIYDSGDSLVDTETGTSYTVTGLTASTGYNYCVTAVDVAGNESVASDQVTATTWETPGAAAQSLFDTGVDHSLRVSSEGSLWAWGRNDESWLGDGATADRLVPTQLGLLTDWSSVSAKGSHSVAIKVDGSLWTWGNNDEGQLGDGTTADHYTPVRIGTDTDWWKISTGLYHTLALKTDGSLWAWGRGDDGEIGDGATSDRWTPTRIGSATDWVSVHGGGLHSIALKEDGSLWAWGSNWAGQLGDGTTANRLAPTRVGTDTDWRLVSTGVYHTLALRQDGSLWGWGHNIYGQLGDGTTSARYSPIRIGADSDWGSVSAGLYHTLALKTDSTLWAWGQNFSGQVGDDTTTDRTSPIRIGTASDWSAIAGGGHSLAQKKDNSLWAWGNNSDGQLGDGTTTDRWTPVAVAGEFVTFDDANLEAVVRSALGKPTEGITGGDMATLTSLDAAASNVSDLGGLEYAINLSELSLYGNQLSDLTPLQGLVSLERLYLYNNQVSDLTPLQGLTSLDRLYVNNNQISDLTPLQGLASLTWLYTDGNQISDLSPLQGLTSLDRLYVNYNQVSNLAPLQGLTNLTWLSLTDNQISDLTSLQGLTSLEHLYLYNNQISDLTSLQGLTSLTTLSLFGNQISDLTPLQGLTSLPSLYLQDNQILDLTPLQNLVSLSMVGLSNNQIVDLTPLQGLTNLTILNIDGNEITDISPLVANTGIGSGNTVDVRENCLDLSDGSSAMLDVQTLAARGTNVLYQPQKALDTTPPTTTISRAPLNPDGSNDWFVTAPVVTLTRDEPGTTYYQLDAQDPGNWSVYSAPLTTPEGDHHLYYFSVDSSENTETVKQCPGAKVDLTNPTAPTLTLGDNAITTADVSWTAASDVLSGVSSYRIYLQGGSSPLATASGLSTTVSGLSASTEYTLVVRAVDAAGRESANSNAVSFTTDSAQSVSVEEGPNVTVTTPSGVTITFDEVTAAGTFGITPITNTNPNPAGFRIVRGSSFDITFTGTFTGSYTITLPYDPAEIQGANESNLKLFHRKDNRWDEITISVDTVANTITGRADSFSEFDVGAPSASGTTSAPVSTGVPASSSWSLGLLAVLAMGLTYRSGGLRGRDEDAVS